MDLSKLLHGFVKLAYGFVKVVTSFYGPFPDDKKDPEWRSEPPRIQSDSQAVSNIVLA